MDHPVRSFYMQFMELALCDRILRTTIPTSISAAIPSSKNKEKSANTYAPRWQMAIVFGQNMYCDEKNWL